MSEELHTLVGLYVVDALDDDEQARFEAHLAGCAACQQEVAEFRATTGRLSQLMAERPPETLRAATPRPLRSSTTCARRTSTA